MFLLILVSGGGKDGDEKHFNTSHVSINHVPLALQSFKDSYFNTSHVSINRSHRNAAVLPLSISIHLMFLLIAYQRAIEIAKCNFNTSHVSINPAKLGRKATGDSDFNTSHVSINHRMPVL